MKKILLSIIALTFIFAGCSNNSKTTIPEKDIINSFKEAKEIGFKEISEKADKTGVAEVKNINGIKAIYIEDKDGIFVMTEIEGIFSALYIEGEDLSIKDINDLEDNPLLTLYYNKEIDAEYYNYDDDVTCYYDANEVEFAQREGSCYEEDVEDAEKMLDTTMMYFNKVLDPNTSFVVALLNMLLITVGLILAIVLRKTSKVAAIVTASILFLISLLMLIFTRYSLTFNILVILLLVIAFAVSLMIIALTEPSVKTVVQPEVKEEV